MSPLTYQEEGFLNALAHEPDDETLRLIYADWLEEQGDVRADLVRVQVELAGEDVPEKQRTFLRLRERELLAEHGKEWAAPLRGLAEAWQFRRGVLEAVTLTATALLDRAEQLFRLAPILELRIVQAGGYIDEIAALPQLGQLHTLRLDCSRLGDGELRPLLRSRHLAQLRALDLRWNDLTDASTLPLLDMPRAGRLRQLWLGGNHFANREPLRCGFGPAVDFGVERDADHLYLLQPCYTWVTGLTATGRQALVLRPPAYGMRLTALCFDLDGRLHGPRQKEGPAERPLHRRRLDYDPQLWAFASELGFIEGPIEVRRFAHQESGVRITDFSTRLAEAAAHPPAHPDEDSPRSRLFNDLKTKWVPEGCFVFWCGDSYWMEGTGFNGLGSVTEPAENV
jgi:uncharacterized protein (TIGR02996 family)